MKAKLFNLAAKAEIRRQKFINDISGSETTEKVGMIVVAVIIIGVLITFLQGDALKGLFDTIVEGAKTKFAEILGT